MTWSLFSRECVRVLTGADHHGVKRIGVVEHLAKIGELLGIGVRGTRGVERLFVDVAQHDDVLGRYAGKVGSPASAGADDGNVQLLVSVAGTQKCRGRNRRDGGAEKSTARDAATIHGRPPGQNLRMASGIRSNLARPSLICDGVLR